MSKELVVFSQVSLFVNSAMLLLRHLFCFFVYSMIASLQIVYSSLTMTLK